MTNKNKMTSPESSWDISSCEAYTDHLWIEAQWENTQPLAFRNYESYERFEAYHEDDLGQAIAYNEVEEVSYFSSIVKMVRECEGEGEGKTKLKFYINEEEFKFEPNLELEENEDSFSFHPIVEKTKTTLVKGEMKKKEMKKEMKKKLHHSNKIK